MCRVPSRPPGSRPYGSPAARVGRLPAASDPASHAVRGPHRVGKIFNAPGTIGYDPEHDFGHGRGSPAGVPVTPDPPAFAAHAAATGAKPPGGVHAGSPARAGACSGTCAAHRPYGLPLTAVPVTGVLRPMPPERPKAPPAKIDGTVKR